MFVAATLTLLTFLTPLATAQEPTGQEPAEQGPKPILPDRDHQNLSKKLRAYLAADTEYQFSDGKQRKKARKNRQKTKEKFFSDWEKAAKKGNVLASMPDLRAIFYNCFEVEKPRHGNGNLYPRRDDELKVDFHIIVPPKYNVKSPWRSVIVLPDGKGGKWSDPEDYFDKTWQKTPAMEEQIVMLPTVPQGLELDPIPDYSRQGAELDEGQRIKTVLGSFGYLIKNYNVDRGRVLLDCGRETCGFGIRFATLFPDRWAGLILRDPIEVDDLRIGNLTHTPILLLKSADNAARVDALKKRFDEECPGMVTVLDAKGAYPHKESADDIAAWAAQRNRNMSPTEVVLQPNHDRFNKAYWVDIEVADPLLTCERDKRPSLKVSADRAANRITVDAVAVERFELLLNDDLVDLDKPFTIVINGKAIEETRRRSFRAMQERMVVRGDWDFLFPVRYVRSVPKE